MTDEQQLIAAALRREREHVISFAYKARRFDHESSADFLRRIEADIGLKLARVEQITAIIEQLEGEKA